MEKNSVSKKSRKKRLRAKPTKGQAVTSSETASRRPRTINTKEDFQPDYTYVIEDLKRIGILAGGFVTLLIVLSFFLG
jgi:hypothetical protein